MIAMQLEMLPMEDLNGKIEFLTNKGREVLRHG